MKLLPFIFLGIFSRTAFSEPDDAKLCDTCTEKQMELSIEDIKQIRFGYLKQQLLKKLHLPAPPKTNLPKPSILPFLAIEGMAKTQTSVETERTAKAESIAVYPLKDGGSACFGMKTPCVEYDFPVTAVWKAVDSAEVWFFRPNTSTFIQAERIFISKSSRETSRQLQIDNTSDKNDFVKFDLSGALNSIVRFPILTLRVTYHMNEKVIDEVVSKSPLVILRGTKRGVHSRVRRNLQCVENSTKCCRENFFVKFSEMGWENWILFPDGYEANFCRGRCISQLNSFRFSHSTVLHNFIRENSGTAEQIGIKLCCTPSVMSPLSIVYRNDENLVYHKVIENMKVEECNCA